ncbi:deoxyhypusine synthase, partial [Emergomyces africanus]
MARNGVNGTSAAPSVSTAAVLKQSIDMPKGAQKVKELNFDDFAGRSITVEDLINGTSNMGFQASSICEAVRIINEMRTWRCPETGEKTTIFLGYTSNLISSGLRGVFRYLVEHKHVSAVVTTAGGVEEDLIKCIGDTYMGAFNTSGALLREQGLNRI